MLFSSRFPWRQLQFVLGCCICLGAWLLIPASQAASDPRAHRQAPARSAAPERAAAAADTLIVNRAFAPSTLDPARLCNTPDIGFIHDLYALLTKYGTKPGPNGTQQMDPSKVVPDLARSWTVSRDGKTYTFKLVPNAKFPSGRPIDSSAVKYSLDYILTANGCSAYVLNDGFYNPTLVSSIRTPDATTVVIRLSRPNYNFPRDLAAWVPIMDPGVVRAHGGFKKGKTNEWMASHAAASGPFVIESYDPSTRMVLRANPRYYGPAPASKRVIVNFITSESTLLLQARSGAADITIGLSKSNVKSLERNNCCRVIANTSTYQQDIGLPNKKPPFNNRLVRQALSYAVPYDNILKNILYGYGVLYYGPIPPGLAEFNPRLSAPRTFDMARAKRLMAQSGVQTPVSVEMIVREGNPVQQQIATIVQTTWRELGVNVAVRVLGSADYDTALQTHKAHSYLRIDTPVVADPGFFLGYDMKCTVSFNLSEVCIPAAERLLDRARQTRSPQERQRLWDQITRLWVSASPKITVYADKHTAVLNKRVKTYEYSLFEIRLARWGK
jgi:peptide/nickel transport system substrate-binding protein